MIDSTDDIFEAFDGPAKVGSVIGVTTEHAAAMRRRSSIPAAYWPPLVSAAAEIGRQDISFEALAQIAADRRGRQRLEAAA